MNAMLQRADFAVVRFLAPDFFAVVLRRVVVGLRPRLAVPVFLAPVLLRVLRRRPLVLFAVVLDVEREVDEDLRLDVDFCAPLFDRALLDPVFVFEPVFAFLAAPWRSARPPDPLFLPPPSLLLTVAQAMRSAAFSDRPLLRADSSMCRA